MAHNPQAKAMGITFFDSSAQFTSTPAIRMGSGSHLKIKRMCNYIKYSRIKLIRTHQLQLKTRQQGT